MPHERFLIEPHPFGRIEDHLNWDIFPHDSKKEIRDIPTRSNGITLSE